VKTIKLLLAALPRVLSTFHPKAPSKVELAMARNPIIYGLAKEIYVADSSNSGGTWSGVKAGLRKGRSIFVRRASDDEICANNLLIDLGGIAVDENGDPESQKVIEKQALLTASNQDDLSGRIVVLLTNVALTAKEICTQLGIDMPSKQMTEVLSKMEKIEKVKIGRSVKYRVRQQEIFDLQ